MKVESVLAEPQFYVDGALCWQTIWNYTVDLFNFVCKLTVDLCSFLVLICILH